MMYFGAKEGRPVYQMDAAAMKKRTRGVARTEVNDSEPAYRDGLIRLTKDGIIIGKTPADKAKEDRVAELKQKLSDTDYIAVKIAEGASSTERYARELADRALWRQEINRLA